VNDERGEDGGDLFETMRSAGRNDNFELAASID